MINLLWCIIRGQNPVTIDKITTNAIVHSGQNPVTLDKIATNTFVGSARNFTKTHYHSQNSPGLRLAPVLDVWVAQDKIKWYTISPSVTWKKHRIYFNERCKTLVNDIRIQLRKRTAKNSRRIWGNNKVKMASYVIFVKIRSEFSTSTNKSVVISTITHFSITQLVD